VIDNNGNYKVNIVTLASVRTFTLGSSTTPGIQELNVQNQLNATSNSFGESSLIRKSGYLSLNGLLYEFQNSISNSGVIEFIAGHLTGQGVITTTSDGLFLWWGGELSSSLILEGPGLFSGNSLKTFNGELLTINNILIIESDINCVKNAKIYVSGATSALQFKKGILLNSNDNTCLLENEGIISGKFTMVGSFNNKGQIDPRNDAENDLTQIDVNGNLTLSSTSSIIIELDGSGTDEGSYIKITGHAILSGSLEISMGSQFTATTDTVIDILNYDSAEGDFTNTIIDQSKWDNTVCNTYLEKGSSKYTLKFNCNPPDDSSSFPILIVAVAGGGGLLLIIIISVVAILVCKRVKAKKEQKKTMMQFEYFNYIK
jgi:hypothetical protein